MDKKKGMAIMSLVLGIVSIISLLLFTNYGDLISDVLFILATVLGSLLAIPAFVLGIIARKNADRITRTCASIGMACSAFVVAILLLVLLVIGFAEIRRAAAR